MPHDRTETTAPHAELGSLVDMALSAIQREYPYHLTVLLDQDDDLRLPRDLTPAFRGAFDWHSSVHSHWVLVRASRLVPVSPWAIRARTALALSFAAPRMEAEHAFLRKPGREGWERPYGLAWLLQLAAELRAWNDSAAAHWLPLVEPLEQLAAHRLLAYMDRLPWPVRSGEHSQTAFALGLFHDWARDAGHPELVARIVERSVRLYGGDREAPVRYEPSAQDFLSPILGEADLMRRAMPPSLYGTWLTRLLPSPDSPDLARWLVPVASADRTDGKFAHLDGLNLSRAWMLDGILSGLPAGHPHEAVLTAAARAHREAGLAGVQTGHWAGTHWLGSFAAYLVTGRGLAASGSGAA
jgi:hypothetical protein